MRFAFTEDQITFRDAVREFLDKECTPAHLRDAWTNETGRIPGLWEQLVDMGVVGMLAPEASGGLGLTMLDLVLILEETGRCALPEPIVETAAFGVSWLDRSDAAVSIGHTLVPWADTADVIVTSAGQFDRNAVELVAHTSVDGARRAVRSARHADRDRRTASCGPRSTAPLSAPPRSSAGSRNACSI